MVSPSSGPHRDELLLTLGALPAKGYASHGESWSFALSLKLACFELLRADGDDPVLVLDDVFAELDDLRRVRLASRVVGAEQVLVTAAVEADLPTTLAGHRFTVSEGSVRPDELSRTPGDPGELSEPDSGYRPFRF